MLLVALKKLMHPRCQQTPKELIDEWCEFVPAAPATARGKLPEFYQELMVHLVVETRMLESVIRANKSSVGRMAQRVRARTQVSPFPQQNTDRAPTISITSADEPATASTLSSLGTDDMVDVSTWSAAVESAGQSRDPNEVVQQWSSEHYVGSNRATSKGELLPIMQALLLQEVILRTRGLKLIS